MLVYDVQKAFEKVLGPGLTVLTPKHESFGDFAVNVMQMPERPSQDRIAEYVNELREMELFDRVESQGAFINVFVSTSRLQKALKEVLDTDESYGSSDWGKGQTWELEHTSPNPNKAMHLGHLRNNVYAMALGRLWEKVGINVFYTEMDNNRGIAIARLMWGYLKFAHKKEETHDIAYWYDHQDEWYTPEDLDKNPSKFVDELYVKASAEYEKDEDIKNTIRQIVVDWEANEPKTRALWETVLSYSNAGKNMTLKRLGNRYDKIWHEHEHYEAGKKYVEKGLEMGIFKETEEGTVITQLEKDYNLPDTVVRKSDGTSLYITQDLGLTALKLKESGAERLFWVVGPEQTLAFKQMFAVCEQLGIGRMDQFTHLSYGWMSLKGQGSMSSRKGNVIYIDDLLDEAASRAMAKITDPDTLDAPLEEVSEKVGVGAVKYGLLRVGRTQEVTFDFDESLSFEGNSGPYLQYAYARMRSILRKSESDVAPANVPDDLHEAESSLLRALPRFPEVVLEAAQSYSPHVVATYLFDLTQKFNAFYENAPVLQSDGDVRAFRLALTAATAQIVKNGLALLGIETLEKM